MSLARWPIPGIHFIRGFIIDTEWAPITERSGLVADFAITPIAVAPPAEVAPQQTGGARAVAAAR
jgi:hypothetical protein